MAGAECATLLMVNPVMAQCLSSSKAQVTSGMRVDEAVEDGRLSRTRWLLAVLYDRFQGCPIVAGDGVTAR